MKRGETRRITIESLAPDGSGAAVVEGRKIGVKGALPGDTVDVTLLSVKRNKARVRLESLVEPGIERIAPACPHFDVCGGCRWQDVPCDVQLSLKAGLVSDAISKVPQFGGAGEVTAVPSPDVFHYRNKMEFTIDGPPWLDGRVLVGLHEAGKFDRVFDVEDCRLQSEVSNRIVAWTREFIRERGLAAYGLKSHEGLLRFLVVREGKNNGGGVMVNLVTSGEPFPEEEDFAAGIVDAVPEVTTVLRTINRTKASVASGGEKRVLRGPGTITETIGGSTFVISPESFFQTNSRQTERLYDCIRDFCAPDPSRSLLDLYCGTGTIGIFLADDLHAVTGIEIVGSAVEDARRNAALNGVENCTFIAGKVEDTIDETMSGEFDTIICDPPRAGIHPRAMSHLLRMRIPRFIHVSCNVKALPADLESLAMAGYRLKAVRAFDMSPHTAHVETVALLEIG